MASSAWAEAYGGGGSSAGGSAWAQSYGGGGGTASPHVTSAQLQHAAEHLVTGGSQSFLHSVEGLAGGVLNAVYLPARAATLDVKNHPESIISGPVAPLTANLISFTEGGGGGHLYKDIAKPIGISYKEKYGPVVEHPLSPSAYRKVGHNIAADPLGSFLDLATIITLPFTEGASSALEAGATGARAARLARTASLLDKVGAAGDAMRANRVLSYTNDAGNLRKAELRGSPNPITRGLQSLGDRLSEKIPSEVSYKDQIHQVPYAKSTRVERQYLKEARKAEIRFKQSVAPYRRALGRLSEPEMFASAALSTGVNADGLLKMWQESRGALQALGSEASAHAIRNISYLAEHKSEIEQIMAHASDHPNLLKATRVGHKVAKLRESWILEAEQAKPEGDVAGLQEKLQTRLTRQADVAAGSRLVPEKALGYTQEQANYAEKRAAYEAAVGADAGTRTGEFDAATQQQWIDNVQKAQDELKTARTVPGPKEPIVAPEHWSTVPPEDVARVTSGIDPLYGGPSYLPHTVAGGPRSAVFRVGRNVRSEAKFPGLEKTEYKRLAMGDLIMHPDLLSRSVLRAATFKGMQVLRDWAMKHSKELNPEAVGNEGVDQGMRLILPYGKGVPHQLSHASEAHSIMDTLAGKEELNAALAEILPKTREGRSIEALNALGARQVPSWVARRLEKEAKQSTNVVLRAFDHYMDFWRALVLNYRPAWLVNNIFGQHLLYLMKNMGPLGLRSYARALQQEKGDTPLLRVKGWSKGHLSRRTYTEAFHEVPGGEELMFHGASHSLLPQVDRALEVGKRGTLRRALHKIDVGRAMRYANVEYADNASRTAAALSIIAKHPEFRTLYNQARGWEGVGGELKKIAEKVTILPTKRIGEKSTLKDFIASLDENQVRRLAELTDQMVGNFAELSPFERNTLRRLFPFYSWFKVITTLSLRMGMHDPQRVNLILNLERAAQSTGIGVPTGPMPSYLQGSIAVGGGQVTEPVLSTTGLNPFQTVTQLLESGSAAGGSGGPKFGVSGPLSLINPLVGQAEQTQGIDPFYGSAYQGPGAGYGYKGRALASIFTGLPQYRLAEQTKPGLVGSNYKSTLYANSPIDFWLNFMGLPLKYVRLQEAHTRAKAGQ